MSQLSRKLNITWKESRHSPVDEWGEKSEGCGVNQKTYTCFETASFCSPGLSGNLYVCNLG